MAVKAIVAAGDGRAAKAVYGESKVYLEIAGRSLVARVVSALQRVPEVSEVWVVGNAKRLEVVLAGEALRHELVKPLHIVPQYRNLYENAWETWRRSLPGADPEGRDPRPEELDQPALFLSGDLPFATPQEISSFVRRGLALDCDYVLGLVGEEALESFYPRAAGEPGIRMAYFNLREGRFRQNNLHLVRPARLANRHYVEEMYEHRYQKQFGNIAGLAWRILRSRTGGLKVLTYYLLMHFAGVADRRGLRSVADWLRRALPLARVEAALSRLLGTRFRFLATEVGGCAIDIDNEHDYDAACALGSRWLEEQARRAEALLGPAALPAPPGPPPPIRVEPEVRR